MQVQDCERFLNTPRKVALVVASGMSRFGARDCPSLVACSQVMLYETLHQPSRLRDCHLQPFLVAYHLQPQFLLYVPR